MLSRIIVKRYCHSHGRSKCYENVHKLDSIRQDINEIKEIMKSSHEAMNIIYGCSIFSLIGVVSLASR